MKRPSFLKRLTGAMAMDEYEDSKDFDSDDRLDETEDQEEWDEQTNLAEDVVEEGELPVDMYHTADVIIIKALVAGVHPDDLDIAITRDMVTIKGAREEMSEVGDDFYFHRELFWGRFSRRILLPEEVIIDEAEAKEKNGLLEIVLPKLDKERSAQIKVNSQH